MIFTCLTLLLFLLRRTLAQQCASAIAEVIFSDLSALNSAFTSDTSLSGDAAIANSGTSLTTTNAASFGGFFFSPTDFQATGGFSVKFSIQSNDSSQGVGDAFELIIASQSTQSFAAPPFAENNTAFGQAGWSRQDAFVVEFDSYDSGTDEQDSSSSHIAIYLSGTEVCNSDTSFSFGSGTQHTIWVDYNGFSTQAYVRVSTDGVRPNSATLTCSIDIWNVLNIDTSHSVGFSAYNPSTQTGALHTLVGSISVADGYRPQDDDNCASYDRCSERSSSSVCLQNNGGSSCDVVACDTGYVWDVSGSNCCAFLEKEAWVALDGVNVSTLTIGQTVSCQQTRKIIAYLTDQSNCS